MKKTGSILLMLTLLFSQPLLAKEVYLGGESIGIQLKYEGLLISGTYDVSGTNPTFHDIQSGDTLKEINGKKIETIEDFNKTVLLYSDSKVTCTLIRNNQIIYRMLEIKEEGGKLRTGLMIKDEINGIGTLTYLDPENQSFGSLGHEIVDQDTKQLIRLDEGTLYSSTVIDITKAQSNRLGEKQARIHFDDPLGIIQQVNAYGVFGKTNKIIPSTIISTATQEEIKLGPAEMITVLKDEKKEKITIEITKLYRQDKPEIKSFEFIVTDIQALVKTNGIVQGMSGSPIIQNEKLIGAVTHVSGNNPTRGYGIYIDWMLEKSDLMRP